MLSHVKNVGWGYVDGGSGGSGNSGSSSSSHLATPDFILGPRCCATYISLKYHLLHPSYLQGRIAELPSQFEVRVVLCYADAEDCESALLGLNRLALRCRCTLLLAWSLPEAGRYLETLKAYEKKPADGIMERAESEFLPRLAEVLTAVRSVNKSDVGTLLASFGSVAGIAAAPMEEMALCPGLGEKKIERLYDALREPFQRGAKRRAEQQGGGGGGGGSSSGGGDSTGVVAGAGGATSQRQNKRMSHAAAASDAPDEEQQADDF